jgi:putative transposase
VGRKPRVHIPGAFYHLIARGNGRSSIFFEDRHQSRFLELLEEISSQLGLPVHGYCLMTTHVHLILQMIDASVSQLAHRLLGRYSRWLNRELGRTGHLFEKRHRSIRVESDRQLITLLRYVHLNPVRAGIVGQPEDYRWSSHRAYSGLDAMGWLTTSTCYSLLGSDLTEGRARYLELTQNPDSDPRSDLLPPLGSSRCIDTEEQQRIEDRSSLEWCVLSSDIDIRLILRTVEEATHVGLEAMAGRDRSRDVTQARAVAAAIVSQHPDTMISELATALNRDASTLSKAATRIRRRCRRDSKVAQLMRKVSGEIHRL